MIDQLTSLTLEQKVGQLFFIGLPGPEFDEPTRALLDEVSPGGICLFARNIRELAQTRAFVDAIRDHSPAEPFLSIDQEGGLVDRLRRIMTPMPAANKIKTVADAEELASIIAETLRTLGINMDFAPVVDVIDTERGKLTNGLFSREFGRSAEDVVSLAGEFLKTLQDKGCVGCLKHFPGLGASTVDSHEELPQVAIDEETLHQADLLPYRELIKTDDAKAVMVAHAAYPRLNLQETGQNGKLLPSSLSKQFISTLLRGHLGFDGLVITDDLEMGAIVKNYGIGEACKMAINAGADMLAICADPNAIREGFNAVLSEISEDRLDESLARIAHLKGQLHGPLPFDTQRLSELSTQITALNERLA